jgi:hypothetical protein
VEKGKYALHPRLSSFWLSRNLSNPMNRHARNHDIVLDKSREMSEEPNTVVVAVGGMKLKETENKMYWPRCVRVSDASL